MMFDCWLGALDVANTFAFPWLLLKELKVGNWEDVVLTGSFCLICTTGVDCLTVPKLFWTVWGFCWTTGALTVVLIVEMIGLTVATGFMVGVGVDLIVCVGIDLIGVDLTTGFIVEVTVGLTLVDLIVVCLIELALFWFFEFVFCTTGAVFWAYCLYWSYVNLVLN